MDSRTLGILGGGQLGRMMVEAAHRLNIKTAVLDVAGAPAKQINLLAADVHVDGSFRDAVAVAQLARHCDVLTMEIEHVNTEILAELAARTGICVQPAPATVQLIQDKYFQKLHYLRHGMPTPDVVDVGTESSLERVRAIGRELGYPYVLKARTMAYDGRGNFVIRRDDEAEQALAYLGERPLYAERFARFELELAVMVVRTLDGTTLSYPCVETEQKDNICHLVYAPARIPAAKAAEARRIAESAVATFSGAGVYGVEMFLMPDGRILLNEIAPRPHNSGHYTIEACANSQFETHVRAVCGLPLGPGNVELATPNTHAIMVNILGGADPASHIKMGNRALVAPGATLHLYGKGDSRPGRKMGHVTIVRESMAECEAVARFILAEEGAELERKLEEPAQVGIIMGSDSDLSVMKAAAQVLEELQVPFELTIVSAHRTVDRMTQYARSASERGLKAIIAGAGGAAHLPGMVAAMTPLPVIGVPVKGSVLDGVDSLHSIVQMPRGVPVATVAINNAMNAGLLAARIIGSGDVAVRCRLDAYAREMEQGVLRKVEVLREVGWKAYEYKK